MQSTHSLKKSSLWHSLGRCLSIGLLVALALFAFQWGTRQTQAQDKPDPFDLGDAPDSVFNHHGITNTAYLGVLGRFPTVWEGTPLTLPAGPVHFDTSLVWLGQHVSDEGEADTGPDIDVVNNILMGAKGLDHHAANLDRYDDGWLNRRVPFPHCEQTTLKVRVARAAGAQSGRMYLNVWFDGNHDGDWADVAPCDNSRTMAHEWIVRNFVVDTSVISGYQDILVPTALILNRNPEHPAWMRFMLAEVPAPQASTMPQADGRGLHHPEGFAYGETEDYLYVPPPPGDPGVLVINKFASRSSNLGVKSAFTYSIELEHQGGTGYAHTVISDVLPAEVVLAGHPRVTELISNVSPLHTHFNSSMGPSGAVGWTGHLSPGARLRLDIPVRVRFCPETNAQQEHLIVNHAGALQTDGTRISSVLTLPVTCEPQPQPQLKLVKHILSPASSAEPPNGTLAKEVGLLPGQRATFMLTLSSEDGLTHTVSISDVLPHGLKAVAADAPWGVVRIAHGGREVLWTGRITPQKPLQLRIHVKPQSGVPCNARLVNQAHWFTRTARGKSNQVTLWLRCWDLGDAPDSTNHYSPTRMLAYPGVFAHYPTVFGKVPPEHGPRHHHPRYFFLGRGVSSELEADIGPDADGHNNLIPPKGVADLDRWDDGLDLSKLHFAHCQRARFPVQVHITPDLIAMLENDEGRGYLNVWLDVNRDGDWADNFDCSNGGAPEHIVIDHPVDVAALGPGLHTVYVTTGLVHWPETSAAEMAWLRVTLSERPSNKTLAGGSYGDGRGYPDGFKLGETEDYRYREITEEDEPDLVVEKKGRLRLRPVQEQPRAEWVADWIVAYRNQGSVPASHVRILDTYSANQRLAAVHSHPPISMTGHNPLVFQVGTLASGWPQFIHLRTRIPITATPGMVITNTAVITADHDSDLSNNVAVFTLTVPLRTPHITFPRPGTTCTGTGVIRGVAQPGVNVDLLVDNVVTATVPVDATGHWSHTLSVPDGTYVLSAVAHTASGMVSPPSPGVKVIVDSSLAWNPLSLRFVDEYGHVILPRDAWGRMDPTGWRVFLRRNTTFTATVRSCCSDPNTSFTLDVPAVGQIDLLDDDGDGLFSGAFTTPNAGPITGTVKLCVTCYLVQYCSDGGVLIDPEGTVFDVTKGDALADATVSCYEMLSQGDGDTVVRELWNAADYDQENPQVTATDGYFSFFTPPGSYQLAVARSGYQSYRSWDLVVAEEPVHHDVPLTPLPTATPDYTVTVSSEGFTPSVLDVAPGTLVAWVNVDVDPHTTTSLTPTALYEGSLLTALLPQDGWDSGLLEAGEVYYRRLDSQGSYVYYDHENPISTGYVIVQPQTENVMIYIPLLMRK